MSGYSRGTKYHVGVQCRDTVVVQSTMSGYSVGVQSLYKVQRDTKVQYAGVYLACTVSVPSCVDPCVPSVCNVCRMPSG